MNNSDGLGGLLGGKQVQVEIAIVEQVTLRSVTITVAEELNDGGGHDVHFDMILSPQAAKRYTIPFSAEGFQMLKDALAAAGSGVKIERNLRGLR